MNTKGADDGGLAVPDDGLVRRIRAAVANELVGRATAAYLGTGQRLDQTDQQVLARRLINDQLESYAAECLSAGRPVLSAEVEEALAQKVFERLFLFSMFAPHLSDERVQNVVANGCDQVWIEYEDGTKEPGPALTATDLELIEAVREIGRRFGLSEREFNPAHPSLNLQLPDGSRLFAVAWVCDRPFVAIRRHRFMKVTLDDLRGLGAIDVGLQAFLAASVRAGLRFMIAGATGAGKTTMLRALASEIPPEERIITIETELELGFDRFPELHPDCKALEAREANVEGVGAVTPRDLVRMSQRMNPDRVILGEVRGDEVVPLLNVMSQGNSGMCTLHADSSGTVFNKLALYAVQAPEHLPLEASNLLAAAAIDLVVFIAKTRRGRWVSSIRQVVGAQGAQVVTNELFRPGPDGRAVPDIPIPAELLDRLVAHDYDPSLHHRREGWWE
jgi:Flp pilus assembly CpaF family ATPase